MPYIKEELRKLFNIYIENIESNIRLNLDTDKDINSSVTYVVYKLIKDIYGNKRSWDLKANALKVLEDVKLEYYRRVLAPHADKKIIENGDI